MLFVVSPLYIGFCQRKADISAIFPCQLIKVKEFLIYIKLRNYLNQFIQKQKKTYTRLIHFLFIKQLSQLVGAVLNNVCVGEWGKEVVHTNAVLV